MQHRLTGQHPADHRGHPVGGRRWSATATSVARSTGSRAARRPAPSKTAAASWPPTPGLTPPVHHLNLQLPLAVRAAARWLARRPRNRGGRREPAALRTASSNRNRGLVAVTATPARPGQRYVGYSGICVGSIHAESGMRHRSAGSPPGIACAGPTAARRDRQPAGRQYRRHHHSASPTTPERHNIGMQLTHFGHSCLLAEFQTDSGDDDSPVRPRELLARLRGHHRAGRRS